MNNYPITIKINKLKLFILLLLCFVFILFGCFLITLANINTICIFIGIIFTSFGLINTFYIFIKLTKNTTGLTIDQEAIIDYSNLYSVCRIDWNEITGIKVLENFLQHYIIIYVKNPRRHIYQKDFYTKSILSFNWLIYGTSIVLSTFCLKTESKDIEELIQKGFQEYQI